jgi:phage tail sheath gpL-like
MPIEFQQFPANWRLPLFWLEVDPSMAGLPVTREPALMVGQMFTVAKGGSNAGTAAPDIPVPVGTLQQAKALFGEGSQIERMFAAFFNNTFAQEVWAAPVAEPSAGTAATGTLTVATPPTQAGTLDLYIAGQHLAIGVAANDTTTSVASNIATAIGNMDTLPVTASPAVGVVTLTCKWKGSTGNDINVSANYYGSIGGEDYPMGLTLTFPTNNLLSGGTGSPIFSNVITALGEQDFKYVAMPFTDATSIGAWIAEYGFGDTGRWGWMRQLYGVIYSAYRATYANMLAFAATQNSGILSILGVEQLAPSPVWEFAAAYCSKGARSSVNDPARPLQTLTLDGVLTAPFHKRFLKSELQVFATAGIATQAASFETGAPPMILRESTTYQLNKYGMSDDAYELVTTMTTLTRLFRNMKQAITSKFPRHKLADDGTRFGAGQAIVTPKIIKAELIAQYRIDEFNGLVENAAAFKANLIVERDPNDPNRVNVLYPPDLINQLRVFAVLAQFRLQYNRGVDSGIGALA